MHVYFVYPEMPNKPCSFVKFMLRGSTSNHTM